MTVSFNLPESIESQLRAELGDLDQVAKEAALVQWYRQAKLTHHQLATALGLDRMETEALLKRHGVTEDLISQSEFDEQVDALRGRLDR